jgi:hypothetical protein
VLDEVRLDGALDHVVGQAGAVVDDDVRRARLVARVDGRRGGRMTPVSSATT